MSAQKFETLRWNGVAYHVFEQGASHAVCGLEFPTTAPLNVMRSGLVRTTGTLAECAAYAATPLHSLPTCATCANA